MGCCLTTTNHRRHNPPPQTSPPPPPAFEEKETVKEVLSETPLPQPQPPPETEETNNVVVLTKNNPTDEIIQENVSDVSEMFSYSESYSAATTATKKEDEEEDGEVTQKLKNNRSPPPPKRVVRKRPTTTRAPVRRQMAASQNGKSDRRDVMVRRSRSPAVRGEMGQRRKVVTGKSPVDEVVPVSDEKSTVKVGGGSTEELEVSESLENPLVSLECFIFL